MVVADLDGSLLEQNTGKRWIRTRHAELYGPLTIRTGIEQDTRAVRFDKRGYRQQACPPRPLPERADPSSWPTELCESTR